MAEKGGRPKPASNEGGKSREKNPNQMTSNEMRRRFASILEVSSIEKQDFRRKPRQDERYATPQKEKDMNGHSGKNQGSGRRPGGKRRRR